MPALLLELLSEEIPALMQDEAVTHLGHVVVDALRNAGLEPNHKIEFEYHTPRRLTLCVPELEAQSQHVSEERRGPRVDAPQKAIEGFLRSAGLDSLSDVQIRADPKKGDFYVASVEHPGRKAEEIIAEVLPPILQEFPWPKSMRWGEASSDLGSFRWIRPLRSILCVLCSDGEKPRVIEFEVGGVRSGGATRGHRFMAPEPFEPSSFDEYVEKLKAAKVILDSGRRKEMILEDAQRLASEQGLELVEDGRLIEEVVNLVEWPSILMGSFPERYLSLPDEVIRLTIAIHQKCFVTRDSSGKLASRFILVSNIEAEDGGALIVRGNERVVAARLADAEFFWESDLRVAKSADGFERWVGELDRVVFYAGLGSQGDRVRRIESLAEALAIHMEIDPVQAKRAAHLAKADLQSAMVSEFPELQGRMGRLYAEAAGEAEEVARAIEEHYQPLGPSDSVPEGKVSVAVALADKIDMLVGFWCIGKKPTGSGDPFALRRAAMGLIRLIWERGIDFHFPGRPTLLNILENHVALVPEKKSDLQPQSIALELLSFIQDRLRIHLKNIEGIQKDFTDAILTPENDDLHAIRLKALALHHLIISGDAGLRLLEGYRRAANILEAEEKKGVRPADSVAEDLFDCNAERDLFKALCEAETETKTLLEKRHFEGVMTRLADLRDPIDAFFDGVLVNAEDESVRANRLALLARFRDAADAIADFSKIGRQK